MTSGPRLAAVARTGLLGTTAPPSYQRLVDLAADLTDAPMGFFTVVDAETSWYRAATGVPDGVTFDEVEASFCKHVIASGEPLFVGDARSDPRTAGSEALRGLGVVAWAGAPVTSPDGQVLGSFCVADTRPRAWTDRDRRVVVALAASAGDEVARLLVVADERAARAAAEEARANADDLLRRQRSLLELMQRSLLPLHLPSSRGLDVAVRYEPANSTSGLGGDWYDVIDLGDGRTGFVIADVAGHDAEAVAVMAQMRPSLHVFARTADRPSTVMRELHSLMIELDVPRFLTIFYGVWDPATATVTYQCAGHPPALLVGADGKVEVCDGGRIPVLGTFIEPGDDEATLDVAPGASLVLFTDGLFERPDRTFDEGIDALIAILGRSTGSAAEVADALVAGSEPDDGRGDDVALMVVRRRGAGDDE